jgi:hypothetical protein
VRNGATRELAVELGELDEAALQAAAAAGQGKPQFQRVPQIQQPQPKLRRQGF